MSDNKLVKTVMDAATLTGLAAGIGWVAKKRSRKVLQVTLLILSRTTQCSQL